MHTPIASSVESNHKFQNLKTTLSTLRGECNSDYSKANNLGGHWDRATLEVISGNLFLLEQLQLYIIKANLELDAQPWSSQKRRSNDI